MPAQSAFEIGFRNSEPTAIRVAVVCSGQKVDMSGEPERGAPVQPQLQATADGIRVPIGAAGLRGPPKDRETVPFERVRRRGVARECEGGRQATEQNGQSHSS